MPQGVYVWSKTAASNSNADSSINWAEGQAPSSVNDSARAVMARVAEYRDDTSGSIITAGTLTAYTAISNQGFASTALMDRKSITIVPHVTSGAAPTLSVDGLAAKPLRAATGVALSAGTFVQGTPYALIYYDTVGEFLCEGTGMADKAILTAQIADKAVTAAKIADNTITAGQIAPGAVGGAAVAPSFVPYSTTMLNGTIVVTQGAGAMTLAIKTLAGADPSAADPTTFMFRDVTSTTGDYLVRLVTSPLFIIVPNGASLGFVSSAPGRVWLLAIDNGGTVELAVFNAAGLLAGTPIGVTNIYPLQGFGLITTQAVSAGGAPGVAYSTTARTNKPYVPVGYVAWEVGAGGVIGVAGTWNTLPGRVQIYQPGSVALPGTTVQQAFLSSTATGNGLNTVIPADLKSIPTNAQGDQYMFLVFTPSSSANPLLINAAGHFSSASANICLVMSLFQDATVNALRSTSEGAHNSALSAADVTRLQLSYQMQAGTLGSTTFKIRATNGLATGSMFFNSASALGGTWLGGVADSGMQITEIMA
jgi:hypothetical protein